MPKNRQWRTKNLKSLTMNQTGKNRGRGSILDSLGSKNDERPQGSRDELGAVQER